MRSAKRLIGKNESVQRLRREANEDKGRIEELEIELNREKTR